MGNCNADQANCEPQQCLGRMLRNAGERSGEDERAVFAPCRRGCGGLNSCSEGLIMEDVRRKTFMDTLVKDTEIKLSDKLEEQIDMDIEQSEREFATGEGLLEAHEAFRLLREKHGFV